MAVNTTESSGTKMAMEDAVALAEAMGESPYTACRRPGDLRGASISAVAEGRHTAPPALRLLQVGGARLAPEVARRVEPVLGGKR
ncbi:hypothetical protein OG250_44480 [Streptomyces sp. NBC_00487]|uniref:hypothetical protein n=1 Tax=unclassified Streptomyces TaxID=2593676 RepID=UPI002E18570C|nr:MULTISPECIES: hypothetical protein [unclassified Streptomyces]